MFNVQIINCMQYSAPDVITKRFALIEKKLLVLNEEERKQGNKKETLTESLHLTLATSSLAVGRLAAKQGLLRSPRGRLVASLHLTVKIARRSNYYIGLRNFA